MIVFGARRTIVNTVRVPPLQYVVFVRTFHLPRWLVRRARILIADLLLPHLRLRFLGVVFGRASTLSTEAVCFGFGLCLAAPAAGTPTAIASAPSAAVARARCVIRIGSFPVKRLATVPGDAGSAYPVRSRRANGNRRPGTFLTDDPAR